MPSCVSMIEPGPQLALGDLGEPEVEHLGEVLHAAVPAEEDVLRLQVAVDDALVVRLLKRAAHLDQDADGALDRGSGPSRLTARLRFWPSRYSITM